MTRAELLQEAARCVTGEREAQYGGPEDSFAAIAAYWSVFLGRSVSPGDVAQMMCLLKLARLKGAAGKHQDSWVDLAGYAACGCEIEFPGKEETKP